MIYGSFALTTGYWTSYAIVLFVWSTLFATNIYLKDQLSYKKKSGWEEYRNKSYILLPKFLNNGFANLISYIIIFWSYPDFPFIRSTDCAEHEWER